MKNSLKRPRVYAVEIGTNCEPAVVAGLFDSPEKLTAALLSQMAYDSVGYLTDEEAAECAAWWQHQDHDSSHTWPPEDAGLETVVHITITPLQVY